MILAGLATIDRRDSNLFLLSRNKHGIEVCSFMITNAIKFDLESLKH